MLRQSFPQEPVRRRCRVGTNNAQGRTVHDFGLSIVPVNRRKMLVRVIAAAILVAVYAGCTTDRLPPSPERAHSHSDHARPADSITTAAPKGVLPTFIDIAAEVGIHFERYDDMCGLHRILEANGGGVALFDYDGDGRLDVYAANGCRLPRRGDDRSHANQLFRNLGGSRFECVSASAGMDHSGYFHGCAAGDFNSDGFPDLYVTAFGRNALCRNNGDGTFSDVTDYAAAAVPLWSSSAAFADFNRDGLLDLYVVNYLDTTDDPPRLCPHDGSPDGYRQCPPQVFAASDDVLLLNAGDGRFHEATVDAGITGRDGKGLGAVAFDADRDGATDLYVANDGTPNFLYRNTGLHEPSRDGSVRVPQFLECGAEWGASVNGYGEAEAGMGIAAGDYDGNGWTDLYVTNFYHETNTLYRNLDGRGFSDATRAAALSEPSFDVLGFGTNFLDLDNDGDLDLFVANGHVDDVRWESGAPYRMSPQVFRNSGGVFREVSTWAGPYFQRRWLGRGTATGDLDGDGRVDLVVSHQLAPLAVLHNETATDARSLQIQLVGRGTSNRSAVGALVEMIEADITVTREVIGGGSFQSASDLRIHLGLDDRAEAACVRVTWPSGQVTEWRNVRAGRYIGIEGGPLYASP